MQRQQYYVSIAAAFAVVAIVSGGSGYWLARQQGWNPLSDLLLWGFLFAFGFAVLLNLLALPGHALRGTTQSTSDFTQLADIYLNNRQAAALPVAHCYRTPDQNTLIYRMPPEAEPSQVLISQLCQLKLQYQCQRVEIICQQQWPQIDLVAVWQSDIHFVGTHDLNIMKNNDF